MFHIAIVLCSGCWCIWHFVWRLNAPWNGDFTGIYSILFTSQKWLSPLSHVHTRSEPTSQWEKTVDCAAISGRLNCPKSSLFPDKSIAYAPKTSKKDTRFLSQDWVFPLCFCAANPHGPHLNRQYAGWRNTFTCQAAKISFRVISTMLLPSLTSSMHLHIAFMAA